MKHVFVVHSNITYLSALGVICKENLKLEDVRIYSPHFIIQEPVKVEKLVFPTIKDAILRFKWSKWFNLAKVVDTQISEFVKDEEFIAYVPSVPFPVNIIVSHPRCKAVHFIEEGYSNYVTHKTLNDVHYIELFNKTWRPGFKQKISEALLFLRMGGANVNNIAYEYHQYMFPSLTKFYGFFDATFVGVLLERKVLMSLKDVSERFFSERYKGVGMQPGDVILLGTVFDGCDMQQKYFDIIEDIVKGLDPQKKIFVKFHPRESEKSRDEIIKRISLLNNNIVLLEKEVMIEVLMSKYSDLTVIGRRSSLNTYAEFLGHTNIDYDNKLNG